MITLVGFPVKVWVCEVGGYCLLEFGEEKRPAVVAVSGDVGVAVASLVSPPQRYAVALRLMGSYALHILGLCCFRVRRLIRDLNTT